MSEMPKVGSKWRDPISGYTWTVSECGLFGIQLRGPFDAIATVTLDFLTQRFVEVRDA